MLIYLQETIGELRKLRDYAENLRKKFDQEREPDELLLDAESLDQRLRLIISNLPDAAMSGNSRRHLSWLVGELRKGSKRTCRQDIDDLADNDIPSTIDALEKWCAKMEHLDSELRDAIVPLIRTMQFDSAIRKAFVVLTERFRAIYGFSNSKDGEDLVNQVFGKDSIFHTTLEATKKASYRNYYAGIFGVIRNKFAHGDHDARVSELEAAVASVNLGLEILEELKVSI